MRPLTAADAAAGVTLRKRELRRTQLARRRSLSAADVERMSVAAQEALLAQEAFRTAGLVHAYVGVKANEVRTDRVLLETLRSGKRLAVPRVEGDRLVHHELRALSELRATPFGLLEPAADAPRVDATELDLVVVPGLAFDRSGNRLGLGKGYYDRFLAGTRAFRAALLFTQQLVDALPVADHDVPMDLLVTEAGVLLPDGAATRSDVTPRDSEPAVPT
ncbi:MAG: 5-formyltetrahydrofolate cyclo-ligase [Gemmatimonadota bacterium]